ncbi:MAG: hypothetical protein ACKOFD_03090 [Actinomycetota bacterium]
MTSVPADTERRSRLLSLKLSALVRDHFSRDVNSDFADDLEVAPFSFGAALLSNDTAWLLIDGDASGALGPSVAWVLSRLPTASTVHLLAEVGSGVLARRAQLLNTVTAVNVWHAKERDVLPALPEPPLPSVLAATSHLAFVGVIQSAGADPLVEHGIVVGEVRGLEICRVVDDPHTGVVRLEVGMGAHDREAFALVHGDIPTAEALSKVVASVRGHRSDGAPPHPLNSFGAERLMRARVIENPLMVNCVSVIAAEPPALRTNVKDAVPCVALGEEADGTRRILVFAHGVNLDVVPFALDAWHRLDRTARITVVLREKDKVASIDRLAQLGIVPVDVLTLKG